MAGKYEKPKSQAREYYENLFKDSKPRRPPPAVDKYRGQPFGFGDAVEVFGLESEKGKLLNGHVGLVTGFNEQTGRFEVRFHGEEYSSLKKDNLRAPQLLPGDWVKVSGLESESGKAFNGQRGHVTGWNEDLGLWKVCFDPQRRVRIKRDNLQRPDFGPGDRVEVFGLESESGKAMNGQKGQVMGYVADAKRWQVNFPELEKVVNVKQDNLARLELGVGDSVTVCNLESEAGKLLNSNKGTIAQYLEDIDRFEVTFQMVTLDSENLTKISLNFNVGDCVEVSGLSDENGGKALNGQKGVIATYVKETSMFQVRFGPNKAMSLKGDFLKKFGPSPGDLVEVWGLDSEAGRQMNGQRGTVSKYLEEKGRFEVKLRTEEKLVSLKAGNLRKVDQEN